MTIRELIEQLEKIAEEFGEGLEVSVDWNDSIEPLETGAIEVINEKEVHIGNSVVDD